MKQLKLIFVLLIALIISTKIAKAQEDESKLKRFRHFVNSDKHDENIIFVEERGQIRPANLEERELLAAENA